MKYPVIFDCCPKCGSTETLCQQLKKELLESGYNYIDVKSIPDFLITYPLADKAKLMKTGLALGKVKVKVVQVHEDVCVECGTVYCVKFDVLDQDLNVNVVPNQMPPKGFNA